MFKLFSGTANPALSQEVAKKMGVSLAGGEVVRFENSEIRVRISEDVKHHSCVLIQSTSNPTDTHLMELFFFCDALRRQEAREVIGVIPYFGYARQDVQHRDGECVSVNVIIKFLESIGFYKIYTVNLHDEATEGVFSIPFKNINAFPVLAQEVRSYLSHQTNLTNLTDTVSVVSPDHGGVERARKFSDVLFGHTSHTIAVVEKKRDLKQIHQSKALDLYGDVKGKIAILVDDLVTSGGTLIHAAKLCMDRGASQVLAAVVHHDFGPEAPNLIQSSSITRFITTNTIALKDEQKFEKLHEVSIAALISEEIKHLK
ncbi:hypothetical protein A2334_05700 [Candidatus Roizmanbacteria bacterium RIFOXYB2_FULL_38_10]|uniref:ribose-phosphate diphosphokinase n=1 Tax=Candidatus Roizmanbacteria bacterium RIFOXYD1_FULL_38_12 TaxID=1802093 RepID=A0A1F7L0W9_9BACT|nr:MAG: hypothetical protein A3K47_02820 [Candidatus Roizmanbacteria bacterium RIFOXYA2_FULL_38_14]OGK63701.1 MAG: hypothetical protein A3K27_02820 [Candidatus Roizmanbacteria bacterium RIFOXYA1_FULL_37_12]OGK65547.1 MAG: hypothetical protein A3K38_02820 [Candidatus Roizmanbacteria bacterium RIFOXYB1_FULL_40_23]OGK68331.1 MAG: hypothetical protein A2334_05700 [Candidatus Roizmanbacteria bacterium RIFOXYB2_FULL_38_10]OGK69952.1 MAG: hypothetical protein A3K21_02825 [Candidatus Roizmanbacteria ba